jgi:hypothetical protein
VRPANNGQGPDVTPDWQNRLATFVGGLTEAIRRDARVRVEP